MRSIILFSLLLIGINVAAQGPTSQPIKYQIALKKISKAFSASFYSQYAKFYMLNEKDFIKKIDSVRKHFNDTLNKYELALDPAYSKNQRLEIKYYFDQLLIDYPTQHQNYVGTTVKKYIIPSLLKINLTDFNKPELLNNVDFVAYVKAYFSYLINQKQVKLPKNVFDNRRLNILWKLSDQYFKHPTCKAFWQAQFIKQHIEDNGIKGINTLYNEFLRGASNHEVKTEISKLYQSDSIGRTKHLINQYKKIGELKLDLHLFLPNDSMKKKRPTIVFFHGGSWSEGKPDWFFELCAAYAAKGWVACAVEYRTYARHGTLPFEAVKDARAAIRWLRKNAEKLQIDPDKIAASGNSAGGHLVLCTALAKNWNHLDDDTSYSSVPNALIVNAGVYDLTNLNTSWIRKDLNDKHVVEQISPNHIIPQSLPPTLIIHGTADGNVPFSTADSFVKKMRNNGVDQITFNSLKDAGHFIWFDPKFASEVAKSRNDFLKQLWPEN